MLDEQLVAQFQTDMFDRYILVGEPLVGCPFIYLKSYFDKPIQHLAHLRATSVVNHECQEIPQFGRDVAKIIAAYVSPTKCVLLPCTNVSVDHWYGHFLCL
jgi:hypothetical protein